MFSLIYVSDPSVCWDGIDTSEWYISVGDYTPEFADHLEASQEDILILLTRASQLISDDSQYEVLAKDHSVPFILVGP